MEGWHLVGMGIFQGLDHKRGIFFIDNQFYPPLPHLCKLTSLPKERIAALQWPKLAKAFGFPTALVIATHHPCPCGEESLLDLFQMAVWYITDKYIHLFSPFYSSYDRAMVKLLIFLGNPGKLYEKSRHNVGWLLCDKLYPSVQWAEKFHSLHAKVGTVRLLKPQTYMNESGKAVRACTDFFNFKAEEILVVHDDLELPFGTVRFQKGGGLQGHNGLKSIKSHLGEDGFYRLRFGIGRPAKGSVASYVLLPFSKEEAPLLPILFDKAEHLLSVDVSALPATDTLV